MTKSFKRASVTSAVWPVIDLFSGGGGMSFGFHAHPRFRMIGAADAELGKPSTGFGALECNTTYEANIGIKPVAVDLGEIRPEDLRSAFAQSLGDSDLAVLAACPPCTGFSRTIASNHLRDDPRNSLVRRTALFVREFRPSIVLMENARELIRGNFSEHFLALKRELEEMGYAVHGSCHMLSRFGLPQQRERAVVIAVKHGLPLRTLEDLWDGYEVRPEATTVRRAIGHLPPVAHGEVHPDDPIHIATAFAESLSLERIAAVPHDGGSWIDLVEHPRAKELVTPAMWRSVEKGRTNSYCDVYGRLAWDRPAATIKRECSHIGNGRYAHPEQDRLCTVREMSILQGFPRTYNFASRSRKNLYRQVGDAVPPLISFQLAKLAEWILTGRRPAVEELILANTHLRPDDIVPVRRRPVQLNLTVA